jgi:hypothetical protein
VARRSRASTRWPLRPALLSSIHEIVSGPVIQREPNAATYTAGLIGCLVPPEPPGLFAKNERKGPPIAWWASYPDYRERKYSARAAILSSG